MIAPSWGIKLERTSTGRSGCIHTQSPDSGKRRSMLKDILCVQVLLKSYGKERGLDVKEAFSYVIFYYGQCSIPKPFSLTGPELDTHFGWPVYDAVEEVNKYFQSRLFSILSGAG
jgi:hypothetical protein